MPCLFGRSSSRLPIFACQFGRQGRRVLILAGVHGDEPEGIYVAFGLLEDFLERFPYKNLRLTLVPIFNPDGALTGQRTNGRGVDLNRNLPSRSWSPKTDIPRYHPGAAPGSESETQALIKWMEREPPSLIISLHSWKPLINVNGSCEREAQAMSQMTGYKVLPHIGYPTPGSLGGYCADERGVPVITYEVERGSSPEKCLRLHIPAIKKGLYQAEAAPAR